MKAIIRRQEEEEIIFLDYRVSALLFVLMQHYETNLGAQKQMHKEPCPCDRKKMPMLNNLSCLKLSDAY